MLPAPHRLDEAEIKLAFLERELAEYKEAVDGLYARLVGLERRVRALENAAGNAGENAMENGANEGMDGGD